MASECLLVEILKNQAQKVTELFSKTHLGSNCYVPLADVHDDKIVKQRYDEIEIGELVRCEFKKGRAKYILDCKVLSNEILTVKPGLAPSISTKKTSRSQTAENLADKQRSKKRADESIENDEETPYEDDNRHETNSGLSILADTSNLNTISSENNVPRSIPRVDISQINEQIGSDTDPDRDYTVQQMIDLGNKRLYPKKLFHDNRPGAKKQVLLRTATCHFFKTEKYITTPKHKFVCKICSSPQHVPIDNFGNLGKHLEKCHKELDKWREGYNEQMNRHKPLDINGSVLTFLKWIITSGEAITEIQNPWLAELLQEHMKLPSLHHLRYKLFPKILDLMLEVIDNKLNAAVSVCLVTDLWTNNSNVDFIGLAALVTNIDFSKELLIINFESMDGRHTAENIKSSIEAMVNKFDFDKSKIIGVVCDEGSNFLKLFAQIPTELDDTDSDTENNTGQSNESSETLPDFDLSETAHVVVETEQPTEANKENDQPSEFSSMINEERGLLTATQLVEPTQAASPTLGLDEEQRSRETSNVSLFTQASSISSRVPSLFISSTVNERGQSKIESPNILANQELDEILKDTRSTTYVNKIKLKKNVDRASGIPIKDDFDDLYNRDPIKELKLEIGGIKIPRFQCGCHELNLAIRKAIKEHNEITDIIDQIQALIQKVKKSIHWSKIFRAKKAKLRLENATRWSSTFLMLESVKRAHDKNVFVENNLDFPVSLKQVEIYLQILQPAYEASIMWQNTNSTISDVTYFLNRCLYKWNNFDLENHPEADLFRRLLIACTETKFGYQLKSPAYKASLVLRSSLVKEVVKQPFGTELIRQGLQSIRQAAIDLLNEPKRLVPNKLSSKNSSGQTTCRIGSESPVYDHKSEENDDQDRISYLSFLENIDKQVEAFGNLLLKEPMQSTKEFWQENKSEIGLVYELYLLLSTIPSSSASIERFFSLCGSVCNPRACNMTDELVRTRCLLKGNLKIIEELGYKELKFD